MTTTCSSRQAIWRWPLVLIAGLACGGCFTGHLVESGRRHESLLRYDRATVVGNELVIEYTARRSREPPPLLESMTELGERPLNAQPRAVAISNEALASHPPLAVEDLPLRRIPADQVDPLRSSGREIPLRRSSRAPAAKTPPLGDFIEVEVNGTGEAGLRRCAQDANTCSGRLYSEALYQDSLAWWVYPLFPLMVAIDVAVLPIHVITLPILVTTGD